MLSEQILKLFESANINTQKFDHFDYAEAFQKLKEEFSSSVDRNPKKKKIIEQFIQKAYQQINKNDPSVKKQKINNFMQRMEMNKRIQQQKLEAMRFISENYDQKTNQLWFYPNSKRNKKHQIRAKLKQNQYPLSASRNYHWNVEQQQEYQEQIDENIEDERPIMEPNLSDEFIQDRDSVFQK